MMSVLLISTISKRYLSVNAKSLISYALKSQASMLPHPDKKKTGGEDAYFVHKYAVGVSDGVGGWAETGVNPALFSRALVKGAEQSLQAGFCLRVFLALHRM
jgi:hypothetical protein